MTLFVCSSVCRSVCEGGALILAMAVLSACATNTTQEETLALTDSELALNTEQPDWETPFWERWARAGQAQAEEKPAPRIEEGDRPLANVGLVLDRDVDSGELVETLYARAAEKDLRFLPGGQVAEALQSTGGCAEADPGRDCLDSLAAYPGLRLLVRVEAGSGDQLTARLHDTSLNAHYDSGPFSADETGARALMDDIQRRLSMAPWSTRVFEGEEGDLYISAARANGLSQDQVLDVREPGKAVKAPSGQVVAFRPGDKVGEIRIREFIGDNLAVVEPVSGQAPGPRHWITVPD